MRRVIVLLVVLGACGRSPASLVDVSFDTNAGTVVVRAEVADEPGEHARGLMGRTSLGVGRGMLFIFSGTEVRCFFMKDTLIPLDLVSVRGGRVVGIQGMEPCRVDPCPLTETPPAEAALEITGGSAARLGIMVGNLVDAPGIP